MPSKLSLKKTTHVFLFIFMRFILILQYSNPSKAAVSPQFILPPKWASLQDHLNRRVIQKRTKMKLTSEQGSQMVKFLQKTTIMPSLDNLQNVLPKTTLELLFSVQSRGVSSIDAIAIADFLFLFLKEQNFENILPFDENTSHIIGREWQEIDYSGEGMTWEGQKKKYLPYGVENFKTRPNMEKFFKFESTLDYFKRIYRPNIKLK